MKKISTLSLILFSILIGISFIPTYAQDITTYVMNSGNNGSLSNMSSGTTTLIGANQSNISSEVTSLGFNFIFMGKAYNTFSVNANGVLRFGNEQILSGANTYGIPGNDRIVTFAVSKATGIYYIWGFPYTYSIDPDLSTHSNGKVHYKVFGSAPNRYIVIEWKNMQIPAGSGSADGTFQLRLYEAGLSSDPLVSGKIEMIYGSMKVGTNRIVDYRVGFGIGPESGNFYAIRTSDDSRSSTVSYVNQDNEGTLTTLSSNGNNSRKYYSFISDRIPTGSFSNFEVTCPSPNALTIKFTEDCSDEAGIAVYRKRFGQPDSQFTFVGSLDADARSFSDGGVTIGQRYVYRFHLVGESRIASTYTEYTTPPVSPGAAYQAVQSGNWTESKVWGGSMPSPTNDVVIGCSGSLFVTVNASTRVNNLTIEQGSFLTIADGVTLEITGNLLNNGVFNPVGTGKVTFIGNTPQRITNNGLGKTNDTKFTSSTPNTAWGNYATGNVAQKQINVSATDFLAIKEVAVTIRHNYLRDLTIYLVAPNGQSFKLAENRGQRGRDYNNVIFTDLGQPLPPSTQNVNLTGSYRPEESFSSYSGPFNGTWTLRVVDSFTGDGGTLQNFELTLSKGGSNNLVLRQFEVNKTNGDVRLDSGISIEGGLTLTNGIVYTDASNFITFESDAISNQGNANSYIDGPAVKRGSQNFVFPVGKDGKWAPIGISDLVGANASTTFQAEYFSTPKTGDNTLGANIKHVSELEYWDLSRTAGTATVNVTLYWKNNTADNIIDINTGDLVVAHYTGGQWKNEGGTVNAGSSASVGGQGSITATGISTFSPFTFGSQTGVNPLPVELLSFKGTATTQGNLLSWATASEKNNSHFEVERSFDGLSFNTIGSVEGMGTKSTKTTYEFMDTDAPASLTYYRLKQLDYDGQHEYSSVIAVKRDVSNEEIKMFPNPANGQQANITIDLAGLKSKYAEVQIINNAGQILIKQEARNDFAYLNKVQISVASLKSSVYFVKIAANGHVHTKKLIIE